MVVMTIISIHIFHPSQLPSFIIPAPHLPIDDNNYQDDMA